MKQKFQTVAVWIVLTALFFVFFHQLDKGSNSPSYIDFESFANYVKEGYVDEIRIAGDTIVIRLINNAEYATQGVISDEIASMLHEQAVPIRMGEETDWMSQIILYGVPVLIVLILLGWILRKTRAGAGNILSLRKSTARRITEKSVKFEDVGGCHDAKAILNDIVRFLKHPKPWIQAGVRLPRGILLEGPTGCGKTLLARAVAGETDASFFQVAASEFVEMFVGVGAARVRDLFENAVKAAPSVIFIDEIDAVGRKRGSGVGSAHDEREQTLNQLLVCMDGFKNADRLVVIAATNRPDILDSALLRPGRFDRRVRVPHLSEQDRFDILNIHTRNKPVSAETDFEKLAELTEGMNGASIESLVNEAALLSVRRSQSSNGDSPEIVMDDFLTAFSPGGADKELFNALDALLIESVSQLAEPVGKIKTRIALESGAVMEGELLWADASHIKIKIPETGRTSIIPKSKILKIETLAGTDLIEQTELTPDRWTQPPELA